MIYLVMAGVGFMFAMVALPMLRDIDRWLDRRAHDQFVENVGWWINHDPFTVTRDQIRDLPETPYDWAEDAA